MYTASLIWDWMAAIKTLKGTCTYFPLKSTPYAVTMVLIICPYGLMHNSHCIWRSDGWRMIGRNIPWGHNKALVVNLASSFLSLSPYWLLTIRQYDYTLKDQAQDRKPRNFTLHCYDQHWILPMKRTLMPLWHLHHYAPRPSRQSGPKISILLNLRPTQTPDDMHAAMIRSLNKRPIRTKNFISFVAMINTEWHISTMAHYLWHMPHGSTRLVYDIWHSHVSQYYWLSGLMWKLTSPLGDMDAMCYHLIGHYIYHVTQNLLNFYPIPRPCWIDKPYTFMIKAPATD